MKIEKMNKFSIKLKIYYNYKKFNFNNYFFGTNTVLFNYTYIYNKFIDFYNSTIINNIIILSFHLINFFSFLFTTDKGI